MGAMKNYLMEQIIELSERTGYSDDFLLDMWNRYADSGFSWSYFKAIVLEHRL